MSHDTLKKRKQKEKNNKKRVINGFNTGTRNMGFASNQDRKEQGLLDSIKNDRIDQ